MDLLLIDKPLRWTSNDVVQKVKRMLHGQKVGHGGTLDPLATGLLILGVGAATKELSAVTSAPKTYECVIQFGYETSTYDLEGDVCATTKRYPTICQIIDTLNRWQRLGYAQIPPVYSALKVGGKPSYVRARAGEVVNLPPRPVEIYDYEIRGFNANELVMEITVSKGFYVRSLAHDLGRAVGSLGTLGALRRTKIGQYNLNDAIRIEDLYDN